MAQGYWDEEGPSSKPDGVAGRIPWAWRLSRMAWRWPAPLETIGRSRSEVEWNPVFSVGRFLSQMQKDLDAVGLRWLHNGRAARRPRVRRDQVLCNGTAEARRRRSQKCSKWKQETRGNLLWLLRRKKDAPYSLDHSFFCSARWLFQLVVLFSFWLLHEIIRRSRILTGIKTENVSVWIYCLRHEYALCSPWRWSSSVFFNQN